MKKSLYLMFSLSLRIALFLSSALLSFAKAEDNTAVRPEIPFHKGATVKGAVLDEGKGLPGVVVSDGYKFTTTDENGFFWLPSKMETGYVFVSIPSGYMPECDGALPQFWHTVSPESDNTVFFDLKKEDNDSFLMIVSSDLHLADRYGSKDITAFEEYYLPALKEVQDNASGKPVYNIILGDMTWDIFWNKFDLARYRTMAKDFPVRTFHVIGNHDYDRSFTDDALAAKEYSSKLGPVWYSFNIGKNHFVVLDNTVYKNVDGRRNHDTYVSKEQLKWLKTDLSYVPKDRRIFIAMHCTAFQINGISSDGRLKVGPRFEPSSKERALLRCLKGREVHIITGDTHVNQSIPPESGYAKGVDIYEHNVAAICSSWWWTWYLSQNHICKDGSEGGFLVFSAEGDDLSWKYRSLEYGFDRQFRAYDMNEVKAMIASGPMYDTFYKAYPLREKYNDIPENSVLVNVWNWDPRWKVRVTENGAVLPIVWKGIEDPLHTMSYDAPRTVQNIKPEYTSTFGTTPTHHIFMVTASSPSTALEIEVEDQFGNVYRETMERPRQLVK